MEERRRKRLSSLESKAGNIEEWTADAVVAVVVVIPGEDLKRMLEAVECDKIGPEAMKTVHHWRCY